MQNELIENNYPDKETIRRQIRNGLANKKSIEDVVPDITTPLNAEIPNLLMTFNEKFRSAGGKYIPCTRTNLVKTLIQICKAWDFNTLLNTSPNLGAYLNKHQVPYITAVQPHEIVDAALFFSDMLVARNGAIGFSQVASLYPSVKNLAHNLIIVSRERCIYQDMEDALKYQQERDKDSGNSTVEFIIPRPADRDLDGKEIFTGMNPRIILMMVEENIPQPTVAAEEPASTQANTHNEPENQEPAD